ncbi:interferon-like [Pezoporus occidentalis]|uniref:interferon-like n=1 Tax=Pezoporus occidentalis TaxID=407982 RepID=UPI002F90C731
MELGKSCLENGDDEWKVVPYIKLPPGRTPSTVPTSTTTETRHAPAQHPPASTHSPTMPTPATPQPRLGCGAPALLLLLTALATGLACHHRPARDDTFPWRSLQLLQAMAPSPTPPCQHQQAPLFPDTLLHISHPQQAAATALRILQHLFHTLSSRSTPQHWHNEPRHQLLSSLNHYIHHLEHCLSGNVRRFRSRGPHNLLLMINKYIHGINGYLHAHSYSACAWDHVRLEAHSLFQHLDKLFRRMKS